MKAEKNLQDSSYQESSDQSKKPSLPPDLCQSFDDILWWQWERIQRKGDLTCLSESGKLYTPEQYDAAWERIHDEFMKEFGSTEDYKKWMRLRMELHRLRLKFLTQQDRKLITFIRSKEMQLKQMHSSGENVKFDKIIPSLEVQLKFTLNEKTIRAKKVYQYLEMFRKPQSV